MGTRWSGKTWRFEYLNLKGMALLNLHVDPHWATPIKNRVRQNAQAKAVYEVVNALNPSDDTSRHLQLYVANGTSTASSSMLTTAARENISLNTSSLDGFSGRPCNSTLRWGRGLRPHTEVQNEDQDPIAELSHRPEPRSIIPSLATLEKAVSARIYFENLYFPLFRHPPSREQRRVAMEKDMAEMELSQAQKDNLRARWLQNETDYLRDRRRKVDASAFIKLKTIGHGLKTHLPTCGRH